MSKCSRSPPRVASDTSSPLEAERQLLSARSQLELDTENAALRAEIQQLEHSRNLKHKHTEDLNENNGIMKTEIQLLRHNIALQAQMNELAAAVHEMKHVMTTSTHDE